MNMEDEEGCNQAWELTDGCRLKSCVRLGDWVKERSISVSYIYILHKLVE